MNSSDPLFEVFANVSEPEMPLGLHGRIVRRVIWQRYHRAVATSGVLLVLSLTSSAVNFWVAAANRDFHHIVKLAMDDFQLNASYIGDFGSMIAYAMPMRALIVFFSNMLLGGYVLWFVRKISRSMRTDLGSR